MELILDILFFWLYGYVAGRFLNDQGSHLRNIIIGAIGKAIAGVIYIACFYLIGIIGSEVIMKLSLFFAVFVLWVVPFVASYYVLRIYKYNIKGDALV